MKPKTRLILEEAIEHGVDRGFKRAFKHTDSPSEAGILQSIEDCIWQEIDTYFHFEPEPGWSSKWSGWNETGDGV